MDGINGNDFQHNNIVYIINSKELLPNPCGIWVNTKNLFECSIYFAVRHCFEHIRLIAVLADGATRDTLLTSSESKHNRLSFVKLLYEHTKACFYFFAWLIRDAPQQCLSPLVSHMQKLDGIEKILAETDTLVELIYEYRIIVKSFEWQTI
jgi:hypothetical protein